MENTNFINAKYVAKDGEVTCVKTEVADRVLVIPLDPANRHFSEIMRQVEEGTLVIQEADNDNS